ncbi:hypothetical protein C5C94_15640 [Rathayibacter sp. AY1C3]|nr:hypothetical protein C5C94_15640 [Rathayibacter sp. AY1C3]PPI27224.1 hypothetical protein C5D66_15865 [Rathayibacter sp. AY1B4]
MAGVHPADRLVEGRLPQVRERFARFHLVVLEEDGLVAAGWAVPIRWDGTRKGLRAGYGDSLRRVLEEEDEATALVVCAAQVQPDRSGAGLAGTLLGACRRYLTDVEEPSGRRQPYLILG